MKISCYGYTPLSVVVSSFTILISIRKTKQYECTLELDLESDWIGLDRRSQEWGVMNESAW